jgi:radical SAM superfamily enzyme YgiQ (UPF0313 family)
MKVLLIDGGYTQFVLSSKLRNLNAPMYPPLGLLYLGRYLEDAGHKVEIIHYFLEENIEEYLKKSLPSIDVVGINVTSSTYEDVANISKKIREIAPSIPIIIGGPHCTFHPKISLNEIPSADICVEGEADFVINDIVKSIEGNGKKLSDIAGVYYRDGNEIKGGKPPHIIKDLDALPHPARHLIEKYDYGRLDNTVFFKQKLASMITSRGCPFKCRFCSRNALVYKTYRQRSAESVINEILEISDKYKSLAFVDDNFLADKKRAHKIMDNLIKNGNSLELLVIGARVDSAEKELYQKMKKAGVRYVSYGIESGNQDTLDFYKKNTTLDQIRKAVQLSNQMNFLIRGNFILGAQMETKEHIENTIKFACSLPIDIAYFMPLAYMYGSDLWDDAFEKGLIKREDEYHIYSEENRKLGNFTGKELAGFCREATKRFYFRPNYFARQFIKSFKRQDFNFLKAGMNNIFK